MKKLSNYFIGVLHNLVRTPAVVGCESFFLRSVVKELESLGIETTEYQGLVVANGGGKNQSILTAHVDRHGLIATGPGEFEYAAFQVKYQLEQLGNSVSEQSIRAIQDRFVDEKVYAYEPWSGSYIGTGTISSSEICEFRQSPMFKVKGLAGVRPGTPIAFEDRLRRKEGFLMAQLDNVLSVAIILELFRQGFKGRALFTSQEEAGLSWRYLLDYLDRQSLSDHNLYVLDTSPFESKEIISNIDLVLRNKDVNGIFDKKLNEKLLKKANQLGYKVVFKDSYIEEQNKTRKEEKTIGRTELGRLIQGSGKRYTGITLQVPTCGYHTSHETCSEKSVLALLNTLLASV